MCILAEIQYKMDTKKTNYKILSFFILALFISCNKGTDALNLTFSKIEKVMAEHPDSALNLLKNIPHPEKLRGKSQADYALLMTEAMDKNYMDLNSDSLIRIAMRYYTSDKKDFRNKGRTCYYYGRVMQEFSRYEEAIKAYLDAKTMLEDSKEYKMLGLISERIGDLYWKQDILEEALNGYNRSREYYTYAKDSCCLSYALRNIARVYFCQGESYDSIHAYYQSALNVARLSKSDSESSIIQELGVLYRERKEFNKAEECFLTSLELEKDIKYRYTTHLSLGNLYISLENLPNAELHLKKCLQSANMDLKADAYDCLSGLEKTAGRFLLALEYREKADSIRRVAQKEEIGRAIADLQKKYDNEKLQKDHLLTVVKYKNRLLICLVLLVTMICFLCRYYFKLNNKKKRIKEIERVIDSNRNLINIYEKEILEYRQREDESEVVHNKMRELNAKVLVLSMQNKELVSRIKSLDGDGVDEDSEVTDYLLALRLLASLKNGSFKEDLNNEDWNKVFVLVDFMHCKFCSRLKEEFPNLTKHDMEICSLLRCGFTHEELSCIFHTTPDSVTKAKGRLKKRLQISVNYDLEGFIRTY